MMCGSYQCWEVTFDWHLHSTRHTGSETCTQAMDVPSSAAAVIRAANSHEHHASCAPDTAAGGG